MPKKKTTTKKKKTIKKRTAKLKALGKPFLRSLLVKPEKKRTKPLMIDIFAGKKCPLCNVPLSSTILCNTEVDYCSQCLGLWFERDELRWAKDEKDKDLNWLDVDIFQDKKKLKVGQGVRICPSCRVPLYEVFYGDSEISIDVCNLCQGIWLDRGEFKEIIDYLKNRADYEILRKYVKNLFSEITEVFSGPETLREEILDVLTVLKLLNYKISTQFPIIIEMILRSPK